MIKIVNKTVTDEASLTVGEYEYSIISKEVNGEIQSVSCSIRKTIDGVITEVGNIRKENGQINFYILDSEDYVQHVTQFKDILEEIEGK